MKYLISSHVSYYEITLPLLLSSLKESGVPCDDIVVVVGGFPNKTVVKSDVEHRFVSHNSFDHTALIEYLESGMEDDHVFLMHDTCVALPDFGLLSSSFDASAEHVPADNQGWFNMGVFSRSFIRRIEPFILSMKDCGKQRAMMSEKMYCSLAFSLGSYGEQDQVDQGMYLPYSTEVQRRQIYLPDLGLIKYVANHSQVKMLVTEP